MKREDWIRIFEKLPETMHDLVVFSLSSGIDVYNQRFLRYDEESLLVRGRLGGTDEGARIFLVPWTELRMIFFARPVEDDVLFNVFGDLIGGVRKSMSSKTRQEQEEQQEKEDDEEEFRPEPVRLPVASVQSLAEATAPKTEMSALRSRLLQQRKPPPPNQTNKPGPGTKPPGK